MFTTNKIQVPSLQAGSLVSWNQNCNKAIHKIYCEWTTTGMKGIHTYLIDVLPMLSFIYFKNQITKKIAWKSYKTLEHEA